MATGAIESGFTPDVPSPRCMLALTQTEIINVSVGGAGVFDFLPADPRRIGFYVIRSSLGFNDGFISPMGNEDVFQGMSITAQTIHRITIYDWFQLVSWKWRIFAAGANDYRITTILRPF